MNNATVLEMTQYLTFKLGNEIFACDIAKVHEVMDFIEVTPVPKMPDFLLGVINLRGTAVPVVDLRLKFGMPKTEKTVNTCIIIMDVIVDNERTILGALADSVQEVLDIEAGQVEPPPRIGAKLRSDFISGMGKQNDRFVIILDIDKIFSVDDLSLVQEATATEGNEVAA